MSQRTQNGLVISTSECGQSANANTAKTEEIASYSGDVLQWAKAIKDGACGFEPSPYGRPLSPESLEMLGLQSPAVGVALMNAKMQREHDKRMEADQREFELRQQADRSWSMFTLILLVAIMLISSIIAQLLR